MRLSMNEYDIDYLSAEYKLNTIVMRDKNLFLPLEILSIRCVDQRAERQNQTFTPYMHQHVCFEMHMPIVGWQTYQIMEKAVSVHEDEVVLFAPNTLHSALKSSDNLKKFSMKFSLILPVDAREDQEDSRFLYIVRELHARPYIKTKPNRWYLELMNRVFLEAYEEKYGWTALVLNMVSQMVIEIVRENLPKEKRHASEEGLQRKRIENIESFIQDNISAMITKQMVAEQMYLSVRQLDRIVLAERGITLKSLIDQIKIREARRLLRETDMTQKDISISLGFTETSSFNRYFRRFESVSPGIYRKQAGKEGKSEQDNGTLQEE